VKRLIVAVLALFGALAVLAVLGLGALAVLSSFATEGVPSATLVEFDLSGDVREWVPDDPIARALLGDGATVRDVTDALDRAAADDRVAGAFVRVGDLAVGFARIQEMRQAIARFRRSGKPIVAWADTFGEFSAGNGAYYLASACDRVFMQPSGAVGLTGLFAEGAFRRGLYDKIGVRPEMGQRFEYKSAMNVHTETGFTAPEREALDAVLASLSGQIVADVATDRGLAPEVVRATIDRAPLIGEEAVAAGLVDRLAYRDEALADLRERAGSGRLLYADRYLERAGRPNDVGRDVIALVYGVGVVVRGAAGYDPLTGQTALGSDDVAAALRAAAADRRVRAIVFRVDSPGGSYVASDSVWREVVRAREDGTPVVVSMGDLAASGGYFVSMDADRIVAQPGTITASIGVLGGKLVTRDLWGKLGISFDETHVGRNAGMWSAQQPYTASGRERLDAFLDGVYRDFTARVAAGRDLPPERVLEIARGRVWTGEDAAELGLVDELGGLGDAVRAARRIAGIAEDARVRVQVFPEPRSPLEALLGERPDSSERSVAIAVSRLLDRVRPAVLALDRAGVGAREPGILTLPEPHPRP